MIIYYCSYEVNNGFLDIVGALLGRRPLRRSWQHENAISLFFPSLAVKEKRNPRKVREWNMRKTSQGSRSCETGKKKLRLLAVCNNSRKLDKLQDCFTILFDIFQ